MNMWVGVSKFKTLQKARGAEFFFKEIDRAKDLVSKYLNVLVYGDLEGEI